MINVAEVYQTKETGALYDQIISLFVQMAKYLRIDFSPFIRLILEQCKRNKRGSAEFTEVVEYIININMVDLFKKNLENDGSDFEDISISSLMDDKRQAPQVAG
jgi:hypothetical protein|tara:strand:- start:2104 stop:2415 length:312 start_codon:yes stop_codon:yes gene_type:complete